MLEMRGIVVWYFVDVVILDSIENFYHEQNSTVLNVGFTGFRLNV